MAGPAPLAVTVVLLALVTGAGATSVADARGRPSAGPVAAVDRSSPAAAAPSPASLVPLVGAARPRTGQSGPALARREPVASRGWLWPLDPLPTVLAGFAVGPHPWSPGHRGVDLAGTAGQTVLSVTDGVVAFAGTLAGRGVVVVRHPNGIRTTYEPVGAAVRVGQAVSAGEALGLLGTTGSHCALRSCLHWGAIQSTVTGPVYLDPLLLVGRREAPVLLPWEP